MAWINEDREGRLANIRCFLLDLDGTVYLEDSWAQWTFSAALKPPDAAICF